MQHEVLWIRPGEKYDKQEWFESESIVAIGYELTDDLTKKTREERLQLIMNARASNKPKTIEKFFEKTICLAIIPRKNEPFLFVRLHPEVIFDNNQKDYKHKRKFELIAELPKFKNAPP